MPEGRPLLLDVNALLALAWPNHQFHDLVLARLARHPVSPWATCALTQIGFVRISSNPKIMEIRKTPAEAVGLLADLTSDPKHVYLDALPSVPHSAHLFRHLYGHQQVTDAYLLGIAEANNAVLLTLDRRIAPHEGAQAHLEILGP